MDKRILKLLKDYDLCENLGYEKEMLDEIVEYDNDYICDAIMEISDAYVSIYNYELWDLAPKLRYYIENSITEFGASANMDLIRIFQQGQYYYNSSLFYENLDNIIWNIAINKLADIVYNLEYDPEIEGLIPEYLGCIDDNSDISVIGDKMQELINDYITDLKRGIR